ncbi:MAG: rhomboid family intramembrane serine protease [Henriciella sp.]|uniref:rhomboid family intramembrane serine protease n=1 Tax=Henriciella sp. TaxID=1968823 RepID=UPI003C726831
MVFIGAGAAHIRLVTDQDMPPPYRQAREPIFNGFPPIVLLLSAAIIAVSALFLFSSESVRDQLWYAFAILHDPNINYIGRPLGEIGPIFLHVLLHVNAFHLIMNMAMMIAFGPAIAKALGPGLKGAGLFLGFFFACAAAGAIAQLGWSIATRETMAAIGASTALSGFFAAAGWLMGGLRGAVRMSLPWLIINLVIAVAGNLFVAMFGMRLAWIAHIGGLAGGFVLFPLFLKLARPELKILR